jgi:hypothetical protein
MPTAGESRSSALFQLVGEAVSQTPMRQPGPSAGGVKEHAPLSWPLHCRHAPCAPAHAEGGLSKLLDEALYSHACAAAPPEQGRTLFDHLWLQAQALHAPVAQGRFGADMKVTLTNDGPVTFWLQVGAGV